VYKKYTWTYNNREEFYAGLQKLNDTVGTGRKNWYSDDRPLRPLQNGISPVTITVHINEQKAKPEVIDYLTKNLTFAEDKS
jgi:hypothetical protein